jgi:hypothetical protein
MFTTAGIVESKSMIFWDIGEIPRVAESWEKTHEKSLIIAMLADNPLYIKKATHRQYDVARSFSTAFLSPLSRILLAILKPSQTATIFPKKYSALLLE